MDLRTKREQLKKGCSTDHSVIGLPGGCSGSIKVSCNAPLKGHLGAKGLIEAKGLIGAKGLIEAKSVFGNFLGTSLPLQEDKAIAY